MGAYYEAGLKGNKGHKNIYGNKVVSGEYFRVNTHDVDSNGLKLMEHSYIGNSYVAHILSLIKDNPTNVIWLCDYSEDETFNWETVEEIETTKENINSRFRGENGFLINHTTKEYISFRQYKRLFALERPNDWAITPLSILTNSEQGSMGGGDLHQDESSRGVWYNHLLSYVDRLGEFKNFTNVTKDSIVIEG